jgi:hypothetical protein
MNAAAGDDLCWACTARPERAAPCGWVVRNPTTLVIGGSLWIMDHLNQNMMPMHQMMQMQR